MSSDNYSQAPGARPPHITVNSGNEGDMVESLRSDSSSGTGVGPGTPGASRNLLPQRPPPPGTAVYGAPGVADSSEMLLPPRSRGPKPYQDDPTDSPTSRSVSGMSSRRTSWDSETGSRDSRYGASPFASPFDDSRAPSRSGSIDDNVNTQTVSEKYNIMPSAGLLLFPEDIEKDDYLHNPDPNEKDSEKCDIWNKRGMTNIGGLIFVTLGVLVLFIGYPVLTAARRVINPPKSNCELDASCLSDSVALLSNIRSGLIDPDTPSTATTRTSADGKKLKLVFSDEFNTDGRTFYDGDDPFFQAMDIWYGVTQDIEWYDPDAVTTANGTLNLRMDAFQSHNLNYRSGMVQSWNQLCFKGGRLEASISLPGRGDIQGFWPGFWAMGNLGRPGFPATTDGMWPYSYWDKCDAGITANQSSADGISLLPGMRLPACTCANEDHPTPGFSRSAPEIDAIEASSGFMGPGEYDGATGTASQSFQAAPFDIFYQPDADYTAVYDHQITGMNVYRGGVYQQALSAVTWLNNDWYDGKAYQTYGFEATPGATGDISWFVGDDYTWKVDGRATRPNGNIGQRVIPEEPMALIMNFGMSNSFATVFLANLAELLPATMRFDYVRIYQEEGKESITCDPTGYETTEYIAAHPEPYANPNLTLWDKTNYTWPQNTLVNGCT
ncbi:putative beta-glucan synthesis-associated protein [Lachnellula hyalina]|uniref:Putative beta-glucan synthesis-associated protein n=1 Tax=Lachnellula hyalina TaxID=1316788 RepID=A0A8H8R1G8_9HELO|nr:putative beta-glucan synthesis-associated protein [Lachnellula hyalina]TVY26618.1 putative beta-glucan synthesis-associated protein [Lachnellula hyalina]